MPSFQSLWFVVLLCFCTVRPQEVFVAQSVGKWRAGSARQLTGNVYTLICFVSGPDDVWSLKEKQEMMKKIDNSQLWLQQQAKRYGVDVNFEERGQYGFEKDIKLPMIARGTASGHEPVDWVSKTLYAIGYTSTQQFVDWMANNTKSKNSKEMLRKSNKIWENHGKSKKITANPRKSKKRLRRSK